LFGVAGIGVVGTGAFGRGAAPQCRRSRSVLGDRLRELVAAVGFEAGVGSRGAVVLARQVPEWGAESGRVAVLIDKSTQDVDAFDPLNLRHVGWRRFAWLARLPRLLPR
jgi:hypothetical protein